MFTRQFARTLSVSTALASAIVVAPAMAQTNVPAMPGPPVYSSVDENGVDLTSGTITVSQVLASIGPKGSALQHIYLGTWQRNNLTAMLNSSMGTIGSTTYKFYKVSVGNASYTFIQPSSGGIFPYIGASGNTLSFDAATQEYTYTGEDGAETTFSKALYWNYSFEGVVTSRKFPNGEALTYTYKSCGSSCIQLQSVASNRGYMLKYEYNTPPTVSMSPPSKITALNTSVDYCDPAADSCTFSKMWPSATIAGATDSFSTFTTTDELLRPTTYTFTSSKLTKIQSPSGVQKNITYDAYGYVQTVSNGTNTWAYNYSTPYQPVVTDPLSNTHTISVNTGLGRVNWVSINGSTVQAFGFDANSGDITSQGGNEGNGNVFHRDSRGNITSTDVVPKTGSGQATVTTTANFDTTCTNAKTCNQPNWTSDMLGYVTNYAYDPTHGGVLTVTAPAPTTGGVRPETRYGYTQIPTYIKNSAGALVQAGAIWAPTSTSSCATTASCAGTADEVKTIISYAGSNNLLPTAVTTQSGDGVVTATTSMTYDDLGDPSTIDGPLPGTADTTRLRYDADGQLVGVVGPDPDGAGPLKNRAQKLSYNPDGQVTLTEQGTVVSQSDTDWAGFVSLQQAASTYDGNGHKIVDSVSGGGTTYALTQYSYDALGRPDCTAIRMNIATFGSLPPACTPGTAGSAGPDRISRISYDARSAPVKVQNGYGTPGQINEVISTYTGNGQLATLTDAKGNTTSYTYDGFDRPVRTCYQVATSALCAGTPTDYEELTPDASGNVLNRRLRDSTSVAMSYDHLNRMIMNTPPGSEPATNYSYDLLGRITLVSQTATGISHTMTWDALSELKSETQPFGSMSYKYDQAGHRRLMAWSDGLVVNYDHAVTGEITAIRENGVTSGPGVLATYSYDDLGRRKTITRGNGTTTSYGYDDVSRLNSLSHHFSASTYDVSLGFTYNPASQIVSATRSNDSIYAYPSVTMNKPYTVNGLNQATSSSGYAIGYDARGNLTSAASGTGTAIYGYNSANLMTSASGGTTLHYDALDRLLEYDTSVSTRYVYDGVNLASEVSNPSGAIQRRYVYGPAGDEPIVWYEGSGTSDRRWLHADERGSVIAVSDGSGAEIAFNSYDEYGVPASGNVGRFQYTGQAWLPELGLYHYKARMYASRLGRFMQADPLGYGDGMNSSIYVGGDPVNKIDPTGLNACSDDGLTTLNPGYTFTPSNGDFGVRGPTCGMSFADELAQFSNSWALFTPTTETMFTGPGPQSRVPDMVGTARRALAKWLGDIADNYLKPPAGRQPGESFTDCMGRIAGGNVNLALDGASAIGAGGNFIPYPRAVFAGGASGTSIISTISRTALAGLPRMGSTTILGTNSVGGAIGRVASRGSVYAGAAAVGWAAGTTAGALQVCSK